MDQHCTPHLSQAFHVPVRVQSEPISHSKLLIQREYFYRTLVAQATEELRS